MPLEHSDVLVLHGALASVASILYRLKSSSQAAPSIPDEAAEDPETVEDNLQNVLFYAREALEAAGHRREPVSGLGAPPSDRPQTGLVKPPSSTVDQSKDK